MNWLKELAKEIHQSQDGDTIYVLNETRMELAQRAALRMGKKLTFSVDNCSPPRR